MNKNFNSFIKKSKISGEEIKERIIYNNEQIQKNLDPSVFILQPEVQKYIEENEYLKTICPHKYSDNVCIYCGHTINY